MAWALPPGAPAAASATLADPAAPSPATAAPNLSLPASVPQTAGPRVILDATLIGIIVVERGPSYALFRTASGSRVVREGEEIVEGARLLQVRTDWIVVERQGIGQGVVPFPGGITTARAEAASTAAPQKASGTARQAATTAAPDDATSGMMRRLEERAQMIQSRMEAIQKRWRGGSGAGTGATESE